MKRFICIFAAVSLVLSCLTACSKVENPNRNNAAEEEKTSEVTTSAVSEAETSVTTTLSPAEISLRAEKSSREAILKAKSEASSLLEEKQAQKQGGKKNASAGTRALSESSSAKKTSASSEKKTVKATVCPYESDPGVYVTKPSGMKGLLTRAWLVKDVSGLDIRISRIEYGSASQMFDSSVSTQIVNPKNLTYTPACTVAVIKCDKPTRLNISKGTEKSTTEANAVRSGAVIAIDGTKNRTAPRRELLSVRALCIKSSRARRLRRLSL